MQQRGDSQHGCGVIDVAPNSLFQLLSERLALMLALQMKIEGLQQAKPRQPLRTEEVWKHNMASRL